jgi:uncharacterized membrane protein
MSESQAVWLAAIAASMILFGVMLTIPVAARSRAFFGYRVSDSMMANEGGIVLRAYRARVALVFLGCVLMGATIATLIDQPAILVVSPVVAAGLGFAAYIRSARLIKPFALANPHARFSSALGVRNLWSYSYGAVETAIVLLTAATIALLIYYYPHLPDPVPVSVGPSGDIERWTEKNVIAIFFAALGLYLHVFLMVIKRDLVGAKMTLPAIDTERFLAAKDAYLRANTGLLDWARLAIAVLFFLVSLLLLSAMLTTDKAYERRIAFALWTFIPIMMAGVAYFIWRMKHVNDSLRRLGESYVQRPAEETHWRHGGLTYHNPDDPALVVEKLVGFGYTWNMAHPAVWSRALLLAGIPVFVIVAVATF